MEQGVPAKKILNKGRWTHEEVRGAPRAAAANSIRLLSASRDGTNETPWARRARARAASAPR